MGHRLMRRRCRCRTRDGRRTRLFHCVTDVVRDRLAGAVVATLFDPQPQAGHAGLLGIEGHGRRLGNRVGRHGEHTRTPAEHSLYDGLLGRKAKTANMEHDRFRVAGDIPPVGIVHRCQVTPWTKTEQGAKLTLSEDARYQAVSSGVTSLMARLVVAVALALLSGCQLAGSTQGCSNVQIDWVDFIQVGSTQYVAGPSASTVVQDSDLGPVVARVKFKVAGHVCDPN